jgi:hypothetical protein
MVEAGGYACGAFVQDSAKRRNLCGRSWQQRLGDRVAFAPTFTAAF